MRGYIFRLYPTKKQITYKNKSPKRLLTVIFMKQNIYLPLSANAIRPFGNGGKLSAVLPSKIQPVTGGSNGVKIKSVKVRLIKRNYRELLW